MPSTHAVVRKRCWLRLGEPDRPSGGDVDREFVACGRRQPYSERFEGVAEDTLHLGGGTAVVAAYQRPKDDPGVAPPLVSDLTGCAGSLRGARRLWRVPPRVGAAGRSQLQTSAIECAFE